MLSTNFHSYMEIIIAQLNSLTSMVNTSMLVPVLIYV